MRPLTLTEAIRLSHSVGRQSWLVNPWYLHRHCQLDERDGETLVFIGENCLLFPPHDLSLLYADLQLWCYQSDLDRLHQARIPLKKVQPDAVEYFYRTTDIISWTGATRKKPRRRFRHFLSTEQTIKAHTSFSLKGVLTFLEQWYEQQKQWQPKSQLATLPNENADIMALVRYPTSIPEIRAIYVTVAGSLQAVSIGSDIGSGLWAGLYHKVNRSIIGLSEFVHSESAKLYSRYEEVTLGDDAGYPGLAQHKLEMGPIRTEQHFLVTIGL
jgi:hypothetical protein